MPRDDLKCKIAFEIYKAAEKLGANWRLLAAIGSYGDTLPDEDVLQELIEYNEGKPMNIICSVFSDGEPVN